MLTKHCVVVFCGVYGAGQINVQSTAVPVRSAASVSIQTTTLEIFELFDPSRIIQSIMKRIATAEFGAHRGYHHGNGTASESVSESARAGGRSKSTLTASDKFDLQVQVELASQSQWHNHRDGEFELEREIRTTSFKLQLGEIAIELLVTVEIDYRD
jgi:hypothetical protein